MPSFHNLYPQFKTLKRPVPLRLGLQGNPPPNGTAESDFELDVPGIEFGDDSALLVETPVNAPLASTGTSDGSPHTSEEMETN
ncbi:MAG: hypothetical protein ACOYKK_04005 [Microbacteriaceae bacterium]|jgi:hypothetical protein